MTRREAQSTATPLVAEGAEPCAIASKDLEAVVRKQGPKFFRIALRMIGSHADATDVVQTAYESAAQQLVAEPLQFSNQQHLSYWVLCAVRHEAIDVLRKLKAQAKRLTNSELSELPDASCLPDREADRRQRVIEAVAVLDSLPDDQRKVWELSEFLDYRQPEIAALLGVPLGTVASRLRLAKEKLRLAKEKLIIAMRPIYPTVPPTSATVPRAGTECSSMAELQKRTGEP